jgi:hypothetical protein
MHHALPESFIAVALLGGVGFPIFLAMRLILLWPFYSIFIAVGVYIAVVILTFAFHHRRDK